MIKQVRRVVHFFILAIASGCFLSYLPVWLMRDRQSTGAGLVGTFWGVALLSRLPLEYTRQMVVWFGALLMTVAVCDAAEDLLGKKDDQRIVADEFIGYWTTMLFVPRSVFAVVLAFILFRLFDTWKPLGIRRLGDLPGGVGVVIDDLAAGAIANVLLHCVGLVHPL